MNNPLIIALVLFGFHTSSSAQSATIDSIQKELDKTQDKLKQAMLYERLAFEYIVIDPLKGQKMSWEIIHLGKSLKNDSITGYGYLRYSNNLAASIITEEQTWDKYNVGIQYDIAHRYFEKASHYAGMATTRLEQGQYYIETNQYLKSIEALTQAAALYLQLNERKNEATVYSDLSVAYYQLGDSERAISSYYHALQINVEINNKPGIAKVSGDMASIYRQEEEYSQALKYYELADKVYQETHNIIGEVYNLNHIGNTYSTMGYYNRSQEFYDRAFQIAKANTYDEGLNMSRFNKATTFLKQTLYQEAFLNLSEAEDYYRKKNDHQKLGEINQTMARLYLELPDSLMTSFNLSKKEALEKAAKYAVIAKKNSLEAGNKHSLIEYYELIGEIWEESNQRDSALAAYRWIASYYKDYVGGQINEKSDALKKLNSYELAEREKTHRAEKERERTIKIATFVAGGFLLISAMISFFFYKKKRDAKSKEITAKFNTIVAETEMKALRAQMNPHFIFNSLNSISIYIQKNELKLADNYLVKFARLMRLILENSEHPNVTIKQDIEALELYMQLEQLRLKHGFNYKIEIHEKIDTENTLIPPLLLQPFVENSIWHGLSTKEDGFILIKLQEHDGRLCCTVEDNGIGRVLANSKKSNDIGRQSLGMKITQSRIDILNSSKKIKSLINVFDLPQGTRVETHLPLEFKH